MTQDDLEALAAAYLSAYIAQDAEGCARTFTKEGALFSPFGPEARGRPAVAATHSEWFAEKEEDKRLEVVEFSGNGTSGHCLLAWSARVPDETEAGATRRVGGVSLCVLKMTGEGLLFDRLALVPDPD